MADGGSSTSTVGVTVTSTAQVANTATGESVTFNVNNGQILQGGIAGTTLVTSSGSQSFAGPPTPQAQPNQIANAPNQMANNQPANVAVQPPSNAPIISAGYYPISSPSENLTDYQKAQRSSYQSSEIDFRNSIVGAVVKPFDDVGKSVKSSVNTSLTGTPEWFQQGVSGAAYNIVSIPYSLPLFYAQYAGDISSTVKITGQPTVGQTIQNTTIRQGATEGIVSPEFAVKTVLVASPALQQPGFSGNLKMGDLVANPSGFAKETVTSAASDLTVGRGIGIGLVGGGIAAAAVTKPAQTLELGLTILTLHTAVQEGPKVDFTKASYAENKIYTLSVNDNPIGYVKQGGIETPLSTAIKYTFFEPKDTGVSAGFGSPTDFTPKTFAPDANVAVGLKPYEVQAYGKSIAEVGKISGSEVTQRSGEQYSQTTSISNYVNTQANLNPVVSQSDIIARGGIGQNIGEAPARSIFSLTQEINKAGNPIGSYGSTAIEQYTGTKAIPRITPNDYDIQVLQGKLFQNKEQVADFYSGALQKQGITTEIQEGMVLTRNPKTGESVKILDIHDTEGGLLSEKDIIILGTKEKIGLGGSQQPFKVFENVPIMASKELTARGLSAGTVPRQSGFDIVLQGSTERVKDLPRGLALAETTAIKNNDVGMVQNINTYAKTYLTPEQYNIYTGKEGGISTPVPKSASSNYAIASIGGYSLNFPSESPSMAYSIGSTSVSPSISSSPSFKSSTSIEYSASPSPSISLSPSPSPSNSVTPYSPPLSPSVSIPPYSPPPSGSVSLSPPYYPPLSPSVSSPSINFPTGINYAPPILSGFGGNGNSKEYVPKGNLRSLLGGFSIGKIKIK